MRNSFHWLTELVRVFFSWGLFLLLPAGVIFWLVTQDHHHTQKSKSVRPMDEESGVALLPIRAVSVSADGQYLDVMQSDAIWRRHDAHTGQELWRRRLEKQNLLKLRIRSDSQVSIGTNQRDQLEVLDDSAVIWEGRLPEQQAGECVRSCSLCQEQNLVAAVSDQGSLWILEFDRSQLVSCEHYVLGLPLAAVAISPSGQRVALVTADRKLLIWDAWQHQITLKPATDEPGCLHVAWSGDGRRLITYGFNSDVQVWQADSLELTQQWHLDSQRVVLAELSFDGRLAAVTENEIISIRDVETGLNHLELVGHRGVITTLRFSESGQSLFSGDGQGQIFRWSVTDQRAVWSML